jgi:hypothetical protein
LKPFGKVVQGDLGKIETLEKAYKDIHTILHLDGDSDPNGAWTSFKKANIWAKKKVYHP